MTPTDRLVYLPAHGKVVSLNFDVYDKVISELSARS